MLGDFQKAGFRSGGCGKPNGEVSQHSYSIRDGAHRYLLVPSNEAGDLANFLAAISTDIEEPLRTKFAPGRYPQRVRHVR